MSILGDYDDLLVEVLIRLPNPRCAFRCKSVSKRWNSLISAPYFSRRFVSHHRSLSPVDEPPLLIPSGVRGPIWSFLPLPKETPTGFDFFVDCFRDLLLLRSGGNNHDELGRTYLVCNPFTQQWIALPLAPKRWRSGPLARLVCEPAEFTDLGSGEEEFTNHCVFQFCVVLVYESSGPSTELDVFYSKSGEWKKVVLDIATPMSDLYPRNAVSLNGKFYWKDDGRGIVVRWDPFDRRDDDDHHHHHPISLPRAVLHVDRAESSICVSQGALHLIFWEGMHTGDDILSVWRLEEEDGSWVRHYRVTLEKLIRSRSELSDSNFRIFRVLGLLLEKSEILLLRSFIDSRFHRFFCNVRRENIEGVTQHKGEYYEDLFQPKVTLWPTPIPGYEKLHGTYNGSYGCWIKPSKQSGLVKRRKQN